MKKKLLACLLFLFPFVAFAGHAQDVYKRQV